ncbi:hypothetical protein CYLTODRAFT_414394 [Cylindrobasidium torrendii FP15055 ss-10]|uniref:RanBP2-type domain-containing protein n=1 Tax=Cylindrobasidium torrendii FP15055 ss-10 TaxID=1314674 RepID=A0A0D7AXI2_9AGAR|nr:hypothetical protein CYLTODRAFT_414394 [Cylindrobasidium torrendii FP15055 ss-10]
MAARRRKNRFLNPLRSSSSNEEMDVASQSGSEPEETPEPEPERSQQPSAAQTLSNVGQRMTRDLAGPSTFDPPPQREALFSPPRKASSLPFPITTSRIQETGRYTSIDLLSQPVETLNLSPQEKHQYAQALRDRANQLEPATAEPANRGRAEFRFSHSPVPRSETSSPARATSPTKLLARNPNGAYRWSGGGSSKRGGRRSETPGFGGPRSSERTIAKSTISTATDNKRRRIGVAGASSTTTRDRSPPRQLSRSRSPAPDPSPTRVAHAPPLATPGRISPSRTMPSFGTPTKSRPNLSVSASTSRLQAPRYSSPATPVVPSPLRQSQTWGQGSPGSTGSRSPDSTPPQKQTKAATIMAGLIKEATSSSKVADVANPYQKTNAIIRPKRARLSARTPAPKQVEEKKPEPALTASAIIDMTLPKGSKRSRPTRAIANGSSGLTIELPTVEEDEHINKRTKPSPPSSTVAEPSTSGPPSLFSTPVATPAATLSAPSSSSSTFGLGRPSTSHLPRPIPREPSKLRHSTKFDSASSDGASSADNSSEPPRSAATVAAPAIEIPHSAMDVAPASTLPSSPFTFAAPPSSTVTVAATNGVESAMTGVHSTGLQRTDTVVIQDEDAIKARILKTSTNLLPRVDFSKSEVIQPDVSKDIMDRVLKSGKAGISVVDFSKPAPGPPATATVSAISSAAPAPAAKAFDFAAAGFKMKTSAGWTCGSCQLTNADASLVKCGICETPREEASTNGTVVVKEKEKPVAPPPAVPVTPFDWAGAGMVKKAASADEWTCGVCGLKSTGKTKCTVCDADRP